MSFRLFVLLLAGLFLFGCQTGPTKSTHPEPIFITQDQQQGFLKGRWVSKVSSRWSGTLKLAINASKGSPEFGGEIHFGESACATWRPFTGTVASDGTITIKSDLGGGCGNAVVQGRLEGGVLVGTYEAEYPDNGTVKLK